MKIIRLWQVCEKELSVNRVSTSKFGYEETIWLLQGYYYSIFVPVEYDDLRYLFIDSNFCKDACDSRILSSKVIKKEKKVELIILRIIYT